MDFEGDDFAITPKEIGVVGLTVADKEYDGTTKATLGTAYTFDGVLAADEGKVTINTTSGNITFNSANVGNEIGVTVEDLELTSTAAQNYSLVQPEGLKGNILPKPITATGVVVANKEYDGTPEATVSSGTLNGVVTADAGKVTLGTTAAFDNKNAGTGKSIIDFSITGTAAVNYSLTQPVGITANIVAKPVTVTANAGQSKQYGKTDPEFKYTVTPSLYSGDILAGSLARVEGENVGMYAVNVGTLTGGNYTLTFISNDFEIKKATATISLSGTKTFTYDGSAKSLEVTTNPAGVGYSLTYDGLATEPIETGNYVVVAAIADANYQDANATATLVINKANQTITFASVADKTMGDAAFNLGATSTSGLAISYEATPVGRVSITNGLASLTSGGRVEVTAFQPGDNNFNAADPIERSFCIKPAKPVIGASLSNPEAPLLSSSSSIGNQWFKDGSSITGATNSTYTVSLLGVYTVAVTVDDCVSVISEPVSYILTGDISTPFASSGFSVYPNPFIDEIRILWNNPDATQQREVNLYDMMGHKIESKAGNMQEFIFDATGLSGGQYLLKGIEGNRTHLERIIKQ
jgi:hypothetical protein